MKLQVEENCPLNNFEKCKQFQCAWFVQMKGTNPNDGKEVDEYACAVAWLPMLLVENAMQSRQTGGAIESFRNEMVKSNNVMTKVLAHSGNPKKAINTASSIFEMIHAHQDAIAQKVPEIEDETIRQLSNNKVKVKKKPKKATTKKVKKNGNNRKQHNSSK